MSRKVKIGLGVFGALIVIGVFAPEPTSEPEPAPEPVVPAEPEPEPEPEPPTADALLARLDDLGAEGVILRVRTYETIAWVTISDAWYQVPCYQRQRVAKGIREHWRAVGGDNIVVEDVAGTEVADFRMFSDDFDIRGCD